MMPGGCLPLPKGYIHVYDHYFQTSFSLKPLGQSKPNLMWGLLGKWEHKFRKTNLKKILVSPVNLGRVRLP